MIEVVIEGNYLEVVEPVGMTNGSVNAYTVNFSFSEEWNRLTKIAMFRTEKSVCVYTKVDENDQCLIPWEVLISYDAKLLIEVCGMRDNELVLPTIWGDLGVIQKGLTSSASLPASIVGGNKGTSDHRMLTNREDPEQHPLEAISGLSEVIKTIPPPSLALTNIEIDSILGG